jgi:hypothetical protein
LYIFMDFSNWFHARMNSKVFNREREANKGRRQALDNCFFLRADWQEVVGPMAGSPSPPPRARRHADREADGPVDAHAGAEGTDAAT